MKGIYDEFRLSGSWTVYFYSMPAAAPGTYRLSDSFPYATGPVEVTPIDEITGKPIPAGSPGAVNFGYFLEVERAGGGFALLSGGWDSFNCGPVTWAPDGHYVASRDPNYSFDYVSGNVLAVGLSSGSTTIASTNAFDVILTSGGPVAAFPGMSVYGVHCGSGFAATKRSARRKAVCLKLHANCANAGRPRPSRSGSSNGQWGHTEALVGRGRPRGSHDFEQRRIEKDFDAQDLVHFGISRRAYVRLLHAPPCGFLLQ